jgi:hypothetical protein
METAVSAEGSLQQLIETFGITGALIGIAALLLLAMLRGDLISRRVIDELVTGFLEKFYEADQKHANEFRQGLLDTQRDLIEGMRTLDQQVSKINMTLEDRLRQIEARLDVIERKMNGHGGT